MAEARSEHIRWCKDRALVYVERGELKDALGSMISDLGKHPETAGHPAIMMGTALMMAGHLSSKEKMREFIEGFN